MMINYIIYALIALSFLLYSDNTNQDYDMDGVPDSIDVCTHTPFFNKVNKNGCSTKRLILPENKDNYNLDIIFDYGLAHNDDSIERENISQNQIELNYYHNSWIYTLKTGYLRSKAWSDIDDTSLSIKRHFQFDKNIILATGINIKFPTHNFEGNRLDYELSQDLNYYPIDNISLFLGGKYSFINDKSEKEIIEDEYSYYLGMGYFISQDIYTNLSYSSTKSKFKRQHLIHLLGTTTFYQINKKWFSSLTYSHEILDEDLHNNLNFKLGYSFNY